MKTLKEYLIEEGLVEQFLSNYITSTFDITTLNSAFYWDKTEEGHPFWDYHFENSKKLVPLAQIDILSLYKIVIPRFRKDVK